MPRFVLLYHACPARLPRPSHWDLMLEEGGVLRTWVVDQPPEVWPRQPTTVQAIQPHRLDYLELEGSLAGDRGTVTRIDRGSMRPVVCEEGRICVELFGQVVRGTLELTRFSQNAPWWRLNLVATDREAG